MVLEKCRACCAEEINLNEYMIEKEVCIAAWVWEINRFGSIKETMVDEHGKCLSTGLVFHAGVEGWLVLPKIYKISDDCQTRRYGPGGQKRV